MIGIFGGLLVLLPLTKFLGKSPGRGGAPGLADQSCQGPKLILHVGPKKTGTSALQDFLVQRATWLDEEWAIGVGFREVKVAAYDLAIPLWEENRIEKDKCEPKQNLDY